MANKRKRGGVDEGKAGQTRKKARNEVATSQNRTSHQPQNLQHPVLSVYFPRVVTLRTYLRSKVLSLRQRRPVNVESVLEKRGVQDNFLDDTLVGMLNETNTHVEKTRYQEFVAFTQDPQRSSHGSEGSTVRHDIADIVDYGILSLFKTNTTSFRPKHILCHGYQRAIARGVDRTPASATKIPGLVLEQPNENVQALKQAPWTDVLASLGKGGDAIILGLLLDSAIFIHLSAGKDNYYQLSGVPISDLTALETDSIRVEDHGRCKKHRSALKLIEIVFPRHRIFYAKPALTSKGIVRFGLNYSHALNLGQDMKSSEKTTHVMKYVFPRQFGLRSVFISDFVKQSGGLKDYDMRRVGAFRPVKTLAKSADNEIGAFKLPRRLRGAAHDLIKKMQRNHKRCPYAQLLRYYTRRVTASRIEGSDSAQSTGFGFKTQAATSAPSNTMTTTSSIREAARASRGSIIQHATPAAQVSAFCQAVLHRLLPRDAFGTGPGGSANREIITRRLDHFIKMRRNESLNLHIVVQKISITAITWLNPPSLANLKMSVSDRDKRWEILNEFVYYVFDSLLIPLIQSNFYVTESAVHRSRLFYFRHDVWRKISEPSLAQLKLTMFEQIVPEWTVKTLGHSTIRLLPKLNGVRIIANLRKKVMKNFKGQMVLSNGINKQLEPLFNVLTYERSQQPLRLGSSIFSNSEIYGRLKDFKSKVAGQKLYFVKLDIKSCFDSIPQEELVVLAETLLQEHQYRIHTHAEIKAGEDSTMSRKFPHDAFPNDNDAIFSAERATDLALDRRRTVYVDTGKFKVQKTRPLLNMLREHITSNTVKIGKKYYRQKNGIPQGSVLSSILCSFFYGAFDAENLSFLDERSLLVRLIDDFLLVTTEPAAARRFLDVMANGNRKYGITVQPSKSLANFDATVNGRKIPCLHGTTAFPYVGLTIDTRTLSVAKERASKDAEVRNGLTVQVKQAGRAFRTKVLHSLKIQMLGMMFDTALNGKVQVLASLYQCFIEMTMKLCRYADSMVTKPLPALVISVVEESIPLAWNLMRQQNRAREKVGYRCDVNKVQTEWVASGAIDCVLRRKQSRYGQVLRWACDLKGRTEPGIKIDKKAQGLIVEEGTRGFKSYVF